MKGNPLSRRALLQASGLGAAALWVPRSVTGYTRSDITEGDGETLIPGVSKWELETPALCVELDALERKLAHAAQATQANGIATRPHAKTHKCPVLAKKQLDRGAHGICVARVSEAEAMAEAGVTRVLITSPVVTRDKIARVIALAQTSSDIAMVVDQEQNVRDFNDAAAASGTAGAYHPGTTTGGRSG